MFPRKSNSVIESIASKHRCFSNRRHSFDHRICAKSFSPFFSFPFHFISLFTPTVCIYIYTKHSNNTFLPSTSPRTGEVSRAGFHRRLFLFQGDNIRLYIGSLDSPPLHPMERWNFYQGNNFSAKFPVLKLAGMAPRRVTVARRTPRFLRAALSG